KGSGGCRLAATARPRSRTPPARLPRRARSRRGSRSVPPARGPTGLGRPARGSLPLHDRTHLDCPAHPSCGNPCRQLNRGIDVFGLVEEVTADGLLHLHERPIGGEGLPVLDSNRRGGVGRPEPEAMGDAGGLVDRPVVGVHSLLLFLGQAPPRLGIVRRRGVALMNQQHVLHAKSSLWEWSPIRQTAQRKIDSPSKNSSPPAAPRKGRHPR